jgi:hypothetical protein
MSIGTTLVLCGLAVLIAGVILFGTIICFREEKVSERFNNLREIVLYCQKLGYGLAIAGLLICFLAHSV